MDKQLFYQKIKEFRERKRLAPYITPEKIARMAYNSSVIEGVQCSYEVLLEEARRLMNDSNERAIPTGHSVEA